MRELVLNHQVLKLGILTCHRPSNCFTVHCIRRVL